MPDDPNNCTDNCHNCHCFYCLVMILDLTQLFSNFLTFIFSHDWSCPPCSHDLCLFFFTCFIFFLSPNHMAKRSHHCIMIFSTLELFSIDAPPPSFYIFCFYFSPILSHITTLIIPIKTSICRPNLEKSISHLMTKSWNIISLVQRWTPISIHKELPRP